MFLCKLRKKAICVTAAAIMSLSAASSLSVSAAELPDAFWTANPLYEAAVNSQNYGDILTYGQQVVDMVKPLPEDDQTIDILGSRLYEMAFAAYFTNDYARALQCFSDYIPFAEKKGWTDGLIIAKNYVLQLTPRLDLYKGTTTEQKYYGAKNEPHGVLVGEVSESTREHDSMVLLYLEYGDTNFNWPKVVFEKAQANHQTVELALNFPNQGSTARSVSAYDDCLAKLHDFVAQYSDVPVLLRIGAEVNIWGDACTPDEFKNAFNSIASVMRPLPNVAVVWSVAHTADWNRNSADFYPGDENVDWVGVTAYPNKYFSGQRWEGQSVFNEIVFKTGYAADPVLEVKEIIDQFGDRKPIMISECGSAYHTGGSINENHIDWSVEQLKNMYGLIPMVYPQVKLMAYFNKLVTSENNHYDYNSCAPLGEAYANIKTSPWFIQDSNQNTAQMFFEKVDDTISGGSVTVGTYPRLYGSDTITVDYYVNDEWAATSHEAPYKADLTLPENGQLKVVATGNNGAVQEKVYNIGAGGTAQAPSQPSDNGDAPTPSQPTGDNPFVDVAGHWSEKAVIAMYNAGVINGMDATHFAPDSSITKAQFVTLIVNALKLEPGAAASGHWASGNVAAAKAAGIIADEIALNTDDDYNANITREEMASIVTRAAKTKINVAAETSSFTDAAEISAWAKDDVDAAVTLKIVSGNPDGSFEPKGEATRAAAATMMANFFAAAIN